jgi:SAM-dependent methyltransferase
MNWRMDNANPLTANLENEDWAGEMGERWLASLDRFESMISPVGAALLARAAFSPGERVIDVGCGGGASSREIAASVAPGGVVMGLDVSPALIGEARRRASAEGITNATFSVGDAATTLPPGAPFDRLFSRFGTMFFTDPPAAFRNLGRMVKTGGRADLAVWAPAKGNPWVSGLMGILRNHMEMPPPVPGAPGPFSLDDPERLRLLLEGGGFAEIDTYFWQGQQLVGGAGASAASAARFVLDSMSFGRVVAAQPQSLRHTIEAEIQEHFAAHQTPSGVVMGANAWLVSARRL